MSLERRELNSRKKLLIITVGTGSNGQDIAHGINYSISKQNPDIIYLILSEKSKETTLPFINNYKKEVNEIIINEVNDVEKLVDEYSEILRTIIDQGYLRENITIDYTSGTKSMSSALLYASISNNIGCISYVYGERGDGGRVISGTERIHQIEPTLIFTESRIKLFIQLFNKYQYDAALNLFPNEEIIHPKFIEKVKVYKILANTYSSWEKFDFCKSLELLKNLNNDELLGKLKIKSKILKNKEILFKLNIKELDYNKVCDLLSNATRRAEEGKYDDAIARLYRALEMTGQIEFKKEFNCDTDNVILENLPEKIRENYKNMYLDDKENTIKVGLYATFEALKNTDNRFASIFYDNLNDIKSLLAIRNSSILAHGITPVKKESFDRLLSLFSEKFGFNEIHNFIKLS